IEALVADVVGAALQGLANLLCRKFGMEGSHERGDAGHEGGGHRRSGLAQVLAADDELTAAGHFGARTRALERKNGSEGIDDAVDGSIAAARSRDGDAHAEV